jgi:uncharacterized protein YqgC (DUF456 family)
MSDEFATAIVLVLMLVGLIGTLIPILPGILLMWIAAVIYGFAVGFDVFSIGVLAVITILATVSVAVGIALPKRAATTSGASTSSQLAAGLGAVIGFFAIPVVGIVVGALAGIALAEWRDKGDWSAARSDATSPVGLQARSKPVKKSRHSSLKDAGSRCHCRYCSST